MDKQGAQDRIAIIFKKGIKRVQDWVNRG